MGQSCNTQQGHIHNRPARLTLHSGWWYRQSRGCTCCSAMTCEHSSPVQKIRQRMLCNAQQALLTQSQQCVVCMSDTKTGHVDVAIIANCGEDQQSFSNGLCCCASHLCQQCNWSAAMSTRKCLLLLVVHLVVGGGVRANSALSANPCGTISVDVPTRTSICMCIKHHCTNDLTHSAYIMYTSSCAHVRVCFGNFFEHSHTHRTHFV